MKQTVYSVSYSRNKALAHCKCHKLEKTSASDPIAICHSESEKVLYEIVGALSQNITFYFYYSFIVIDVFNHYTS